MRKTEGRIFSLCRCKKSNRKMKKLLLILFVISALPLTGNSGYMKSGNNFINRIEGLSINEELGAEINKKDASGENVADGSIHIKIKGGNGPYSISIFSTVTQAENFQSNKELILKNVKAGKYLIIIQDNQNHIYQEMITISAKK